MPNCRWEISPCGALCRKVCVAVTHGCWAPAVRYDLSSNMTRKTGSGSLWHTATTVF